MTEGIGEFEGLALVVAVDGGVAHLLEVTDVVGGGRRIAVPVEQLPDGVEAGFVLYAEILHHDGEWIVEAKQKNTAQKVKPKVKKDHWVVGSGNDSSIVPFPSDLSSSQAQQAQQAEFWLFAERVSGLSGQFEDLWGYLEARVQAKKREQEQRDRRTWRKSRDEYDPDSFVNPYNFVPLPQEPPSRRQPSGHASRRSDLLHGHIDVRFVARSPLLVRDASAADEPSRLPRRGTRVVVPGSSVKGALRSMFEAQTGSCMRVVDLDFVPAYRDVLRSTNRSYRSGWSLVEVVKVDRENRPIRVRRSRTEPVWFAFDVLESVLGKDGVRTGARFVLTGEPGRVAADRRLEVRSPSLVAPVGSADGREMTLLVTDVRASRKATCFVAAEMQEPVAVTVDPDAWKRFEAAADGGQDLKRGKVSRLIRDEVKLTIAHKSRGVAYRQMQGVNRRGNRVPGLRGPEEGSPGHVVWAKFDGGTIIDIAFAQTWRHGATGSDISLESRLPPGYAPCTGADGLCPACRVFGSANTRGQDSQSEKAYRGHVRLSDFDVRGATDTIDLAPMGEPRAGSGQMYLQHEPSGSGRTRAADDKHPLREWGSELDAGSARTIRGRKLYWRVGTPPGRKPRYQAHRSHAGEDNQGNLLKRVEVASEGSEVSGRLTFENLTYDEVGAVLSSLDPARLREFVHPFVELGDEPAFCFTVGGGKPLGLGALECAELTVTLEGAASRYTDEAAAPVPTLEDLVRRFVHESSQAVRDTWPDLLEMVRWNAVNPAMVSYPRDEPWPDQQDTDDDALYEPGFQWWKRSAGMPRDGIASRDQDVQDKHSYVTLPRPTDTRITLPIDIQDGTGGGGR